MDEDALQKKDELQRHVASTYGSLRFGLGLVGLVFPLLLTGVGWYWYGVTLQGSMSAYYLAKPDPAEQSRSWSHRLDELDNPLIDNLLYFLGQAEAVYPMRSWFVGTLFVIGIVMIIYKGFSPSENWLLNFAGLSALGVALFPTCLESDPNCRDYTLHGFFAIAMFILTACVAIFCSGQTLSLLPTTPNTERLRSREHGFLNKLARRFGLQGWTTRTFEHVYFWIGMSMILIPGGVFLAYGVFGFEGFLILIVEWIGMWAFALFWLIKSLELSLSLAEERLLNDREDVTIIPSRAMNGMIEVDNLESQRNIRPDMIEENEGVPPDS